MCMRAIGNINSQIPKWLTDSVLEKEGELRPGREVAEASVEQRKSYGAMPGAQWRFYYADDLGLTSQPWHIPGIEDYHWWIVRLDPGCVFPLHVDTFEHESSRRLWVPLTPPQPGHIFEISGRVFNDFIVGGVYEFDDRLEPHGAANYGRTPKITLQIVTR